jgi:hypothetical protein
MKELHELYDEELPNNQELLEEEDGIWTILICIFLFFLGMAVANVDTEVNPPGKVF